jgi:hypothetical protein
VRELRKSIRRFEPDLHPFEGRPVAAIDVVGFEKTREHVIRREIRTRRRAAVVQRVPRLEIEAPEAMQLNVDDEIDAFKKAAGVCLEGRGYSVT